MSYILSLSINVQNGLNIDNNFSSFVPLNLRPNAQIHNILMSRLTNSNMLKLRIKMIMELNTMVNINHSLQMYVT